jgi:hypothetical protein
LPNDVLVTICKNYDQIRNETNITTTETLMSAKVNHPIIFEKRELILSLSIFLSLASLITIKRIGTVTTALITAANINACIGFICENVIQTPIKVDATITE